MINNRLLSRQSKSQSISQNKSILAISNVFHGIDSDLQKGQVHIDYNGQWLHIGPFLNGHVVFKNDKFDATVKRSRNLCLEIN